MKYTYYVLQLSNNKFHVGGTYLSMGTSLDKCKKYNNIGSVKNVYTRLLSYYHGRDNDLLDSVKIIKVEVNPTLTEIKVLKRDPSKL